MAKVRAINADLLARNAYLELMNEKMRRDKFGASSERSRRLRDQLGDCQDFRVWAGG